ncbi:protein NAP1-like [Quercus suber]|uniref:protein NAP1-like n=1 Tax=Quercus suber TaxID=58331 RepID=UPI0032DFC613
MIVTSSRSNINIRHLEKATVSTGKEGLLSEGNAAYNWSRCVDELESQLSKHGSLKSSISTTSTLQQSSGTPCLDQKDVLSIAVHGLVLLVVFQNVLLPLFRKR